MLLLLRCICLCTLWATTSARVTQYTNLWVAEIHGGEEVAQRVARDLGYTYKSQLQPFEDHYLLTRNDHPELSVRDSSHLTRTLQDVEEVKWAEQQTIAERSKRGYLPEYHKREKDSYEEMMKYLNQAGNTQFNKPTGSNLFGSSSGNIYKAFQDVPADPKEVGKANFDSIPSTMFSTKPSEESQLNNYQGVTQHVKCLSSKALPYEDVFNDPMWHEQWYVQDCRLKDMPVMDHNVVPVYKMGYTGKDITIMITDDGIEHGHRDLVGNFNMDLSYDFCEEKRGCEPDKLQDGSLTNSEGTLSAGIIAMVANNKKCGVGIAYKARVAGAKMLCSTSTTLLQAKALVHELSDVDIYSNSWGSPDDGQTLERISRVTVKSIDKGISEGRERKGSIYVFSAGNGKRLKDNCAADGIANYVGNIVVGSVSQTGKATVYSERCTAIFATAYSGSVYNGVGIVATSTNGDCIKTAAGTSASVAIASGIIALTLEANSDLTYRDVMHLIAMSSEVAPLANNENTWYKNGRGFWVSNDFGFGLLNAENMVTLAKNWKTVPKENTCTLSIDPNPSQFYAEEGLKLTFNTDACHKEDNGGVHYLEHITLTATVMYPYRGAISIDIKSPKGTKSTLMEPRLSDNSKGGLTSWSIKSVHNWGEKPEGQWTIFVKIASVPGVRDQVVTARTFILTLYGTAKEPAHYNKPRKYAAFRLPEDEAKKS